VARILLSAAKGRARHNVGAARGVRERVVVVFLWLVKVFHALLLLPPRLFVVLFALAARRIFGGMARVRRARAHRRGPVKLVARTLLERGHRNGAEAPLRRGLARAAVFATTTSTTTSAARGALPERVLRRRRRVVVSGRALRRGRGHRLTSGGGRH